MNEQTKKLYFVIDMAYKKIYIVAVRVIFELLNCAECSYSSVG